ncbi:phage tail tip lysozyme [Pseudomonas sp. NPDC098747]|uniref:phage tail tip lysozyme n=1 Tax=Pseudomonas sp. NPDC098747 TaxID=3364487 RepID=UPI00383BBDDE
MADDVIKEFMVGLGFKTDEKQLKEFTGGINNATAAVTKLVTAIVGASLTVAAGVSAFASNLEGLYFASQRIGASASSIRASELAAKDLGASADEARGALEGIASFIRTTPGAESYLKGLGVQTRDINGNLRDTGDVLVDLGKAFKGMDYWLAQQYASQVGISDSMLRAIMQDDFGAQQAEKEKRLGANGMDQAAKDANQLMKALRDVGFELELISIQVQAELMREFGPELRKFATWLKENAPMIADRVVAIIDVLIEMAQQAGPYLDKLWTFFVDLDTATDGWSTKIIALLVLLKALGAVPLVGGIVKLANAFFKLGGGLGAVAAGAVLLSGDQSEGSKEAQDQMAKAVGGDRAAAEALARRQLGNFWNIGITEEDIQKRTEENLAGVHAGIKHDWKSLHQRSDDRATFLMDYFESLGWTKEQAAGIVGNLAAETSTFDAKAVGDGGKAVGIAQWHPDRQANFEKWAGFNIHDSRADMIKQAEFLHYELTQGAEQRAGQLLKATTNADAAGRVVSRHFLRPGSGDTPEEREASRAREAAKRGQLSSQFVQNTTINVNGAGDPGAVGRSVAGEQTRVGAEVARNMNTPEVY